MRILFTSLVFLALGACALDRPVVEPPLEPTEIDAGPLDGGPTCTQPASITWDLRQGPPGSPLASQDLALFSPGRVVLSREACQAPECNQIKLLLDAMVLDPWQGAGEVLAYLDEDLETDRLGLFVEYRGYPGPITDKTWVAFAEPGAVLVCD